MVINSHGIHHVFEHIDFSCITHKEFVGFLERFTQEKCEKVNNCQPNLEIAKVLTMISNDLEYQEFIDVTYRCGVQLPVYMDHFGTNLQVFCDGVSKENNIEYNCSLKLESAQYDEDDNIPDVKGQASFNEDIP
uniref:Uncharacterized protein n=1 Tax=Lactuca sativa TaxID=4236 RepID=A0A9R1WNC2_LACSA|nr:hypothetical protein LSAT_V11C100008350 [Lactuca sativa]